MNGSDSPDGSDCLSTRSSSDSRDDPISCVDVAQPTSRRKMSAGKKRTAKKAIFLPPRFVVFLAPPNNRQSESQ